MAKGYSSAGQVELHTGQTLTGEQLTALDFVLEAVEAFIDAETGSAWLTGPVTAEWHDGPLSGPRLWLRQRPIASVTSILGYGAYSATATTFTVNTDYTIIDAWRGVLYLPTFTTWHYGVSVSYTPGDDPNFWAINRAATILAAAMLPSASGGAVDPSVVKSYSIASDLEVTFRDAVASAATDPEVRRLLGMNRRGLVA